MKKPRHIRAILAEMINQSHYNFLANTLYCKDFLNLLSLSQQRLIHKIFIKNDILMIIVKSNAAYQELNHDNSKFNIKFLIKMYAKENISSGFDKIKDIKILTQIMPTKPIIKESEPKKAPYIELSDAQFKNNLQNKALYEGFEKIRGAILNNAQ